MNYKKRLLSLVLVFALLCSVVPFATPAQAVSNTDYNSYDPPEDSGDYAYWNGSKVVKSSSTTTSEIKWMQAAMNYLISVKYISGSYLSVDGSFGPASKAMCIKYQAKVGLTQDGSFGPASIKKMKQILSSKPWQSSTGGSSNSANKTLSFNMSIIQQTGYQPYSGPCGCFAVAYCRDILDNRAHKWTEFNNGGTTNTAVWSKANYVSKNGSSKQSVLKACYDNIKNGKPVVLRVTGNGSSGHYVTIVGYTNVNNVNSLSESNFLIIDPVKSAFQQGVRNLSAGSTGYKVASTYQYIVSK